MHLSTRLAAALALACLTPAAPAGSFDSRYFGPIRRDDVEGVFRESLTW